ncbi:MAG: hypothetical protein JWR21_3548 [Herminiimonas sp.]|nr:hypothetical protein [Herminiimonas sp.]
MESARSTDAGKSERKTRSGQETKQASAEHVTAPRPKAAQRSTPPVTRQEASAGSGADDVAPAKRAAPDAKQVVTLAALPLEIRAQIPAVNITGFLYAGSRSERSILIDNRLMHEGDQVAANLMLEEMRPTYAIFNYRGTRFSMPYR